VAGLLCAIFATSPGRPHTCLRVLDKVLVLDRVTEA